MLLGLPITLYHEFGSSVRHRLTFVSGMQRGAILLPSTGTGYSLVQSQGRPSRSRFFGPGKNVLEWGLR